MKLFLRLMTGNVIIVLGVLLGAASCIGREEHQNGNNAVETPQLAQAKEEPDFIDGWQYEIGNDEYKSAIADHFAGYYRPMIIDGVQYAELNIPSRAGIVVSYLPSSDEYTTFFSLFLLNANLEITGPNSLLDKGILVSIHDIVKYLGLNYDFIKDIPGRQVGNSSVIVGDYNKDGYDDIIIFGPIIHGYAIQILCYVPEHSYFEIALPETQIVHQNEWITWDQGPPIQFGTYNGMDGLVLHEVSRNKFGWYFYAWDNEERKFIEIEQVNPGALVAQPEQ